MTCETMIYRGEHMIMDNSTQSVVVLVLRVLAMAMAAVSIALALIGVAGIELYAIVLGIGLLALSIAAIIEARPT